MSNLLAHAAYELEQSGLLDKDSDYGGALGRAVLALIESFSSQGHSGFSANMTVSLFERLARFEPLSPLTGEDHEWNKLDYGCEPTYQNKRCSHVFKDSDGRAYDCNAIIFEDEDGMRWTSRDSRVDIQFPYTPKTEYVKREISE